MGLVLSLGGQRREALSWRAKCRASAV